MGYGVSSPEVQRLEHHKISLPCIILLLPERTRSGSARLHEVPGRRHTQSSLSWKTHIDRITKQSNSMLGFLRRNLRSCSEETKANAYFIMGRSNLEYCSSVSSPHHKDQIHKIEMVQRRAAPYTTNCFRNTSSVSSMIYQLQWESLESRRSKIQLTLFFKVIHNLIDIPPDNYLTPSTTRTRSTHSKKYRQFSPSTDSFKFSFFPRTLPLWNS